MLGSYKQWLSGGPSVCDVADPSTLPKPLLELHQAAMQDGEAIRIMAQSAPQEARWA